MSDLQFELFERAPWTVRQRVPESMELWHSLDWCHTEKARHTGAAFKRIVVFWSGRYIDELSKVDMEALRHHLSGLGLKASTINTHHMMVTRWMTWLFECKKIGVVHGIDFRPISMPADNIGSLVKKADERQFQRQVAWSKLVVHKLVAAAHRMGDQMMADIIEFLYISKLRQGDVYRILDRNVDLAHLTVHGIQNKSVRRNRTPKPYIKPVTPRMETILRRRIAAIPTGQPVFREHAYELDAWRREVNRRFNEIRAAAGLIHVQLWDMKPSAATLELDNGVDTLTVSQGLGHADDRMLPVYARRNLSHQREAQLLLEDNETEILK